MPIQISSEDQWQQMKQLALQQAQRSTTTGPSGQVDNFGLSPTTPRANNFGIATLQNTDPTTGPGAYTDSTLVYGNNEADLAKNQIARGGTAALNILGVNPTPSSTNFDYSHIKPVTSPDDLLNNPKFVDLARNDPTKASSLFQAFTGKDFATHLKDTQAQTLGMQKRYEEGIQNGLISGDLRRNPTMGWLERRRVIPNPLDPTQPQKVTWEPAPAELQTADKQFNKQATGYARPGMTQLLDNIDTQHQDAFLQEFNNQKAAGKQDHEAAQAGLDLIKKMATSPAQLAQMGQPAPITPPPTKVPEPDTSGMTDEQYQNFATQQTKQGWGGIGQAVIGLNDSLQNNVFKPIAKGVDYIDNLESNAQRGLYNLPNKIAVGVSGKPLYPWMRPQPPKKTELDPFYSPANKY